MLFGHSSGDSLLNFRKLRVAQSLIIELRELHA